MRMIAVILLAMGLAACHGPHGSVHVDDVGSASWGNGHHGHKGCPPGLAKQGRCH